MQVCMRCAVYAFLSAEWWWCGSFGNGGANTSQRSLSCTALEFEWDKVLPSVWCQLTILTFVFGPLRWHLKYLWCSLLPPPEHHSIYQLPAFPALIHSTTRRTLQNGRSTATSFGSVNYFLCSCQLFCRPLYDLMYLCGKEFRVVWSFDASGMGRFCSHQSRRIPDWFVQVIDFGFTFSLLFAIGRGFGLHGQDITPENQIIINKSIYVFNILYVSGPFWTLNMGVDAKNESSGFSFNGCKELHLGFLPKTNLWKESLLCGELCHAFRGKRNRFCSDYGWSLPVQASIQIQILRQWI